MSLGARLARAEAGLSDALLWYEAQKIAAETGRLPEQVFEEAREMLRKYQHLERRLRGGKVDVQPMLRALAEGENLDYDELAREVQRTLRRWRRREGRAQR